jgi:hypothetical protein
MEVPEFPKPEAYGFDLMNRSELVILIAQALTRIRVQREAEKKAALTGAAVHVDSSVKD